MLIEGPSCPAAQYIVRLRPPTGSALSSFVTATRDDGTFRIEVSPGDYYAEILTGTLPVYGRLLQVKEATRLDVTLQAKTRLPSLLARISRAIAN